MVSLNTTNVRTTLRAALRWGIGLCLPGLLCLLLGALLLWAEAHSDWGAQRLGSWLLQHNASRQERGAVWQGIIASRRARSHLDSTALPALAPQTLPPHILERRYEQLQRTPHFARWRTSQRRQAFDPQQLSNDQLRELAQSMQVFSQVDQLLQHIELPVDAFQIHARIYAQTRLEDASLFPVLHRHLLSTQAPAAWNFTHMATADKKYWQQQLQPLLGTPIEIWDDALPEAPSVRKALRHILGHWSDSLRTDEVERLRKAWRQTPGTELRIARNLDIFAGYALLPRELPVRFEVPAILAQQAVDWEATP